MKKNLTKSKLLSGKPAYGLLSSSADPMLAELAGHFGFDYYMLDGEHGLFNPADAVNVVRACELSGLTPTVRIGPQDPKLILQYMDAGFMGIMMPGLMTVESVQMLVNAVKYPPFGKRGLGPVRANDYHMGERSQADYVDFSNDQTLVITQFEAPTLLHVLGDIVKIKGMDAVMIGPRDLSLVMGYKEGPNFPEVQDAIDRGIHIIKEEGKIAGLTATTRQTAQGQVDRGANLILISLPSLLQSASRAFLPP
jgi:4-hydroxy-2-oxoheptanedioate aldolase